MKQVLNFKTLAQTGFTLLGALILVSCAGQSSNPTKEYQDVKGVRKTDQKSPTQFIPQDHNFIIKLDNADGSSFGQFIQGKTNQVAVRVITLNPNIKSFTFSVGDDFPYTDRPTVSNGNESNVFIISWTPQNIIERNKTGKTFEFTVYAKVTDAAQKELVGITSNQKVAFSVTKDNKSPSISNFSLLGQSIAEGSRLSFTLEVTDPNYEGTGTPKISISPYHSANPEGFRASASPKYIDIDTSKKVQISGKKFTFSYILDLTTSLPDFLDEKEKVDPKAPAVKLCFNAEAKSVDGTSSDTDYEYCVEAVYSAQEATAMWEKADKKATTGIQETFKVKLNTSNGISEISLKDGLKQIASLPGEKTFPDCVKSTDGKNSLSCEFTLNSNWQHTCGEANVKKFPVKLNVVTTLGTNKKNIKTSVIESEIEVTNPEANCKLTAAQKKAADTEKKKQEAEAKKLAAEQKKVADAEKKKQAAELKRQEAEAKAAAKTPGTGMNDKKAEQKQ